ncbi:MAG TPA: pitrilysin family protein [Candidatus Omnitrophota bacterium]|nr:pitrilysin family protein [Candidatus Omnitrophota bacterium]HRY85273.1 pitrilysin family protein [Candidatus Omnitrophota bacterium]
MVYHFTTLENGVRVLTVPMPNRDSAAVAVWVKTGGRYEPKRISGVSHFLEHMLFKGTPTRNTRQIKESIEGVGGILNAFTGEEVTCYFAKLLKEHYPRALEVLSDMVLNATIPADELAKERPVILEEIKMYRDLPSHHVHDLMGELLWPEQPLGRTLSGPPETIAKMTRSDILNYKRDYYHNANILIAVSGDVEHSELLGRVGSIYGISSKKKPSSFVPANSRQTKPRTYFFEKKTEQTHLVIGLHALPRMHPDRYKLGLLHVMLGANMSSRLFEELREKRGLAYEIKSSISAYHDAGAFTVSAGVETKKTARAVEVILKELGKVRKSVVKEGELRRAKDYFKSQVALGVEDTLDHLLWAGEKALCSGELPDKEDIYQKIEEVSAEDIRELARRIFRTGNLNLSLIGPVPDKMQRMIAKNLMIEGA